MGGANDRPTVELGRLYQRAATQLDAKELRSFLLHQAEWLIHLPMVDDTSRSNYVAQTREYLQRVIGLHPKPRRHNITAFRPELVDE